MLKKVEAMLTEGREQTNEGGRGCDPSEPIKVHPGPIWAFQCHYRSLCVNLIKYTFKSSLCLSQSLHNTLEFKHLHTFVATLNTLNSELH